VGKTHYAPESLFPFEWGIPAGRFGRDDVGMAEACEPFVRGAAPFFLYWCSHNPHRAGVLPGHPLGADSFGNPAAAFAGDREQPYREDEVIVPPFLSDTPEAWIGALAASSTCCAARAAPTTRW
jgi:N-sulfoglucosamine sulfohydrolase